VPVDNEGLVAVGDAAEAEAPPQEDPTIEPFAYDETVTFTHVFIPYFRRPAKGDSCAGFLDRHFNAAELGVVAA